MAKFCTNARISNKFMWRHLLTKFASYRVLPVMVSTHGSVVPLAMFFICANFWVILGHFWAILALLGHFWAILSHSWSFLGSIFFWPKIYLCYFYYFLHLWPLVPMNWKPSLIEGFGSNQFREAGNGRVPVKRFFGLVTTSGPTITPSGN